MKFLDRLLGRGGETTSTTRPRSPSEEQESFMRVGQPASKGEPRFLRKDQEGGSTYEVYSGSDAESAKAFLSSKVVTQPQYYFVVETDDGVWGMDKEGLYLEKLRPWQTDVGAAECEVAAARLQSIFSVSMAARGITDNFISSVECGACGREWSDGVRYHDVTVVQCPGCGKKNSVDTSNVQVGV